MTQQSKTLGLYLHIPFCRFLCHYCDFVKTARWDQNFVEDYFKALRCHLVFWAESLLISKGYKIASVFVGGGTPSLFTFEYEKIFSYLRPFLTPDAEITLEANPDNMSEESLKAWRSLGFNRISCGVQSFSPMGLKALTRQHKASEVIGAYERARKHFDSVNLDLIYGWSGQTESLWRDDLNQLTQLEPDHVSLYLLTYASGTPIGRAHARGKLQAAPDELLESFYEMACSSLGEKGYRHEEVSNWSLEGKACRHNWLYWQDQYYLAVGAGACGYIPTSKTALGMRYQYTGREKNFCRQSLPNGTCSWKGFEEKKEEHFSIEARSYEIWLLEYLGAGLRSSRGVDLKVIEKKTPYKFRETEFIKESLASGLLRKEGSLLLLTPAEWFRESSWCLKLFESFHMD